MASFRVATLVAGLALVCASNAAAQTSFTGTYEAHDDDASAWFAPNTCRLDQPLYGMEPTAARKHPVLIWVHGTGAEGEWTNNVLTNPYTQDLAKDVIRVAAQNGFLAAYPQYRGRQTAGNDNGTDLQSRCIFNRPAAFTSALDAVCARPKADCSRIVVAGHSQGGMIAMRAANHEPTIRAVYSTSVFGGWGITPSFWASSERGGKRVLPDGRLRIATGNEELNNGWSWLWGQNAGDYSGLRTFTGQSCADGTVSCLRANGSGWHVVQSKTSAAGPTDGTADHCFMSVNGLICAVPQPTDSYWLTGSAPWSFATALRWLKGRSVSPDGARETGGSRRTVPLRLGGSRWGGERLSSGDELQAQRLTVA